MAVLCWVSYLYSLTSHESSQSGLRLVRNGVDAEQDARVDTSLLASLRTKSRVNV